MHIYKKVPSIIIATCIIINIQLVSVYAETHCGKASWYKALGKTASGRYLKKEGLTAAHRWLKFGTYVTVKNIKNGKTVKVRINDRGPFKKGRIIDVSRKAASKLGFLKKGITKVCISY